MRDKRGNLKEFEDTVKSFLKKGWKREDEIPDPVKNYRFPLLHWAGVLGKCRAMEWMIKNGRCRALQMYLFILILITSLQGSVLLGIHFLICVSFVVVVLSI